jgi:hypothetical protein
MELLVRLKLIAQEFAAEDEAFLNAHLEMAGEFVSQDISKEHRDNMICYLAAHRIDQSLKRLGASGSITALKEGNLSVTYAAPTNNTEYDLSSYGRTYAQLVKETTICPMTRMMR